MTELNLNIQRSGESALVKVSGEVTEKSDFKPLLEEPSKSLVLNLEGITRINSYGVREWVKLISALEQQGRSLVFERCSVAVVAQLNMISSFGGSGQIKSALAPYFCGSCSKEHHELITIPANGEVEIKEELSCPKCGEPMEFDDDPDSYFDFIGAHATQKVYL